MKIAYENIIEAANKRKDLLQEIEEALTAERFEGYCRDLRDSLGYFLDLHDMINKQLDDEGRKLLPAQVVKGLKEFSFGSGQALHSFNV